MKKEASKLTKRLALLMSFVILGIGFQTPLYAQLDRVNYIDTQARADGASDVKLSITTDSALDVRPDVTTGGALDVNPDATTDSAYVVLKPDKHTVYVGQETLINYSVEIGHITTSSMIEVEMTYDESQLTFVDAHIELQGNIPIKKEVIDGKFYINFEMIRGQDFKDAQKVLNVQLKTNAKLKIDEEIKVYLNKCSAVAMNEKDEANTFELIDNPQVARVKVIGYESYLDINQDGNITLEDLSIVMKYYGMDETHILWEQAKRCDVTQDGRVDMADLVALSSKTGENLSRGET